MTPFLGRVIWGSGVGGGGSGSGCGKVIFSGEAEVEGVCFSVPVFRAIRSVSVILKDVRITKIVFMDVFMRRSSFLLRLSGYSLRF